MLFDGTARYLVTCEEVEMQVDGMEDGRGKKIWRGEKRRWTFSGVIEVFMR